MTGDFTFALRQFRKSPGFAVTAIVTLALGLGATTAIFTLFDQVLLRMLPVASPQALVRFRWTGSFSGSASSFGGDMGDFYSYPMYVDLRNRNSVFSGVLAADRTRFGVTWHNQSEDEEGELVSGNYFQVLGLKPAAGRLFASADETAKDADAVAVLSYEEWRTRFGGSTAVVGQRLLINSHPFTIVGVAPENFHTAIGGYHPRVFVPVTMVDLAMPWTTSRHNLDNHRSIWLTLVARLKPGVSAAQAQASLAPLWHALRVQELAYYTSASASFRRRFVDGSSIKVIDDATGFSPGRIELRTPLIILFSMAGLLTAMCTLNLATLLLLRAGGRVREMSMRYALGARPARIVRQLFLEGGLLGVAGTAAGLALAQPLTVVLLHLIINGEPGNEPYSASLSRPAMLFALALSFAVTLLFSLAPVLHFLRPELAGALRQNTGTASKHAQRFRKAAVGVQIALTVVLLGGAGLFVRTLTQLQDQNLGFDTRDLVTFGLDPTLSGYADGRTTEVMLAALRSLARIPGIESVAATDDAELAGDSTSNGFSVQGHTPVEGENMDLETPRITPGYFATMRQPLLAGRDFTAADRKGAPNVAIVNAAFAQRFYGATRKALGRMVGDGNKPDTVIVGVVGDVRHRDLRTPIGAAVYLPWLQANHPDGVEVYVRAAQDPESVEPAIRRAIRDLDPTLVVDGLRTMETQVDMSDSSERALAFLAFAFAALAAALSAVGLYGVLAYSTQRRTREIGVRLALGAPRRTIVGLVVKEMSWIAVAATVAALPITIAVARLFRSQLYDVSAWDPLALAAAAGLTAVMVLAAAALPARRAASVDPMQALHTE